MTNFAIPDELHALIQTPELAALKQAYVDSEDRLQEAKAFLSNAKVKLESINSELRQLSVVLDAKRAKYGKDRAEALLGNNPDSVDDSEIVILENKISNSERDIDFLERATKEKEASLKKLESERNDAACAFYCPLEAAFLQQLESKINNIVEQYAPSITVIRLAKGVRSSSHSSVWDGTGNLLSPTRKSSADEVSWRAITTTAKSIMPKEWWQQAGALEEYIFTIVDS